MKRRATSSATSPTGSSERARIGDVEVLVRVNPRARRIALRADGAGGPVTLVLPSPAFRDQGLRFAAGKSDWIRRRAAEAARRTALADGSVIPLLGKPHRVRHAPGARTLIELREGEIVVGGGAAGLELRVAAWLRAEARRLLAARSRAHATALGLEPLRVTVRDTRSRWGSCSANGALSYCWRLVLAPGPVLDYVAAHEVAHLVEMNHSAKFWSIVARLCPDYQRHRHWLKQHGATLHQYG